MAEVVESVAGDIIEAYNYFISGFPTFVVEFFNLFLMVLTIVLFSVFIWKVHEFISRKNIIELNLNRYNKSEHPFFEKFLAGILYFVEYIVILPFLVFVWFSVFTFFLIILSEGTIPVEKILVISAIIISSIRVTSYYSEKLSKELAKLLPFNLLAFAILYFSFFGVDKIIEHISRLPLFFESILIYFGFIITLELILRFLDFIFSLFGVEEDSEKEN